MTDGTVTDMVESARVDRVPRLEAQVLKYKHPVTLRYMFVDAGPTASSLVVVTPTVRPDLRVKLDKAFAARLVGTGHHLLVVGADKQLFFGPGRAAKGLETLTHLVQEESVRRGVALSQVTLIGRQFGGSIALWLGSRVPVGRVIAGSCPIRMAQFLRSLRPGDASAEDGGSAGNADGSDAPSSVLSTALTAFEDPKVETWLDRTITRDFDRVSHDLKIDLFATSDVAGEMAKLHHDLAKHPTISTTLVSATSDGPDFATFARSRLVQRTD